MIYHIHLSTLISCLQTASPEGDGYQNRKYREFCFIQDSHFNTKEEYIIRITTVIVIITTYANYKEILFLQSAAVLPDGNYQLC